MGKGDWLEVQSTAARGCVVGGVSPKAKGPKVKIPEVFASMVATHAEVCQVGDGELKGRDLKRLIGASIVGTQHETAFKVESVWRRVRKDFPESLQAANKISVDDARAQWTTFDNLNQWFDDVKRDLLTTGLVVDEEVFNNEGGLVSEVRFKKDTERRIINMDETHHDLSVTGDKGGSRAVSYHNPAFQRGANRGVKSARHVTGAYATNSAGEALPPMYIFDSSAKSDENFRVKVDWLVGLPTVEGRPVILKLDAGPGRIVSSAAILSKREEFFERGLIIIMGLPNATSVQQEMDALYGPFKSATYARGEKVVQTKLRDRGLARKNGEQLQSTVLNLDFGDLSTIVNGMPGDDLCDRPFDCHFSKEKILWSWAKVGFVPFTRSCLKNTKVRKELGQHNKDEDLERLQFRYDVLVDSVEASGFNPGIFDAVIPTAAHVQRAATEAGQVAELLQNNKAFSPSGQWSSCESRIGNAGVTIQAQKMQLELNENARLLVVNKKSEARVKILDNAQTALHKYNADENSLNDKDWGDVIRWVLPKQRLTSS
ncbi:hypothetical protein MHU86_920 [Fragilaria crotonensis]|nr:hypothetical protein MHU86_920 [Fragilaria crotonensis]